MKFLSIAFAGFLAVASGFTAAYAQAAKTLTIQLKDGPVVIALASDVAPEHAKRMTELAKSGAFDNVAFHRVIDGFMAQTGDVQYGNMEKDYQPTLAGTGGSSMPDLKQEFSDRPFVRGTVGMARSQDVDSANSQFFIMFDEASSLNNEYTVVGTVVSGMEFVDKIKRGEGGNGEVSDPDRMIKVTAE